MFEIIIEGVFIKTSFRCFPAKPPPHFRNYISDHRISGYGQSSSNWSEESCQRLSLDFKRHIGGKDHGVSICVHLLLESLFIWQLMSSHLLTTQRNLVRACHRFCMNCYLLAQFIGQSAIQYQATHITFTS